MRYFTRIYMKCKDISHCSLYSVVHLIEWFYSKQVVKFNVICHISSQPLKQFCVFMKSNETPDSYFVFCTTGIAGYLSFYMQMIYMNWQNTFNLLLNQVKPTRYEARAANRLIMTETAGQIKPMLKHFPQPKWPCVCSPKDHAILKREFVYKFQSPWKQQTRYTISNK